jgi:hypothetical protein
MNPQAYFADLENDAVRGDRFEDTDRIHQPKDVKVITITDNATGRVITINPEDMRGPLSIRLSERSPCNLFCMFSVTEAVDGPSVDERNFAFGDSFLIVLNTQEFVDRIYRAAKSSGFRCTYGLVEYYDADTYSGKTGPFRKPSFFAYQREFRFAIEPGSRQPVQIVAGNMEDITTPVYALSDINRIVDFSTCSAMEAGLV